jgi:hypothetical protein
MRVSPSINDVIGLLRDKATQKEDLVVYLEAIQADCRNVAGLWASVSAQMSAGASPTELESAGGPDFLMASQNPVDREGLSLRLRKHCASMFDAIAEPQHYGLRESLANQLEIFVLAADNAKYTFGEISLSGRSFQQPSPDGELLDALALSVKVMQNGCVALDVNIRHFKVST